MNADTLYHLAALWDWLTGFVALGIVCLIILGIVCRNRGYNAGYHKGHATGVWQGRNEVNGELAADPDEMPHIFHRQDGRLFRLKGVRPDGAAIWMATEDFTIGVAERRPLTGINNGH